VSVGAADPQAPSGVAAGARHVGVLSAPLAADSLVATGLGSERCPGCGSPLAGEERFCLGCGLRLAPDELRLAALPLLGMPGFAAPPTPAAVGAVPFRRPVVRSAAVTAAVVLALGVAIGATIGPAAVGQTSAAQRQVVLVALAPPAAPPASTSSAEDGSSADGGSSGGAGAPDEVGTLPNADGASVAASAPPAAQTPAAGDQPLADSPAGGQPGDTPPNGSLQLAGVVVASAADGEGFVLAARDGRLLRVHASGCGVTVGDSLHLRARPLANGTWSADRLRRVRPAVASVRVAGTVDWVDPASGRYALGARGAALIVAPPPPAADPTMPPASVPPSTPAATVPATPTAAPSTPQAVVLADPRLPALGDAVRVRLDVVAAHDGHPSALLERARHAAPQAAAPPAPAPPLELAGVVQTIDPQARTLTLAFDDATQPAPTLTLAVPARFDLATLGAGQRVAVTATAAPDGTLALTGASPDGDALAADDPTALQGDQAVGAPAGDAPQTIAPACTVLASAGEAPQA
jgi:Copper binding periplasmic protein CusF